MKKIFYILIIFSIIMASCKKDEPVIVKYGGLKGLIKNEFGQPIEGAIIKIDYFTAKSNRFGEFRYEKLEVKEYPVSVSKEAYLTKVENVTIVENEFVELEFILTAGEPHFAISDSLLNVKSSANDIDIKITSNSGWVINNPSSWLTCSTLSGQGNAILSIKWTKNEELTGRRDTIEFQSGQITKKLVIYQLAPLKIISSEGIIGNGAKGISDSVYVRFNNPVNVQSIQNNWEMCQSDIKYKLVDNNCGIKFTFDCAALGGNYPFTIQVYDESGNLFSLKVNVPFYKSKRKFEGMITDYIFLNDDKEILFSTIQPSKIIRYSIEHDSILKSHDLSDYIAPIRLAYNPYDSKIYIMGSEHQPIFFSTFVDQPYIYSLNLKTGEIVKAITLTPDSKDHPQAPAIIPFDIGFTKSGLGIIALHADGVTIYRYKLIDCARNNLIYEYPTEVTNARGFMVIEMNYDHSKLILQQTSGEIYYGIFDGYTQQLSIIHPGSTTHSVFITPSRKNDKIYMGQLYNQFIMDLSGNLSRISLMDNRNEGSADFSYRENEENIIYFVDKDYFRVMDYGSAEDLMWCDSYYGLKKIRATLDGKYAITYNHNSDLTSNIFVFETKYFYRHQ